MAHLEIAICLLDVCAAMQTFDLMSHREALPQQFLLLCDAKVHDLHLKMKRLFNSNDCSAQREVRNLKCGAGKSSL